MSSPEEQPRPQEEETPYPGQGPNQEQDLTLEAINEVAATLGGAAIPAEIRRGLIADTPEGRMLATTSVPEATRRHVRTIRQKAHMLHQFFTTGAVPMDPRAGAFLDSPIGFSEHAATPEMRRVTEAARSYLLQTGEADPFEMQQHAQNLIDTLTGNMQPLDMADLVLLCRHTLTIEEEIMRRARTSTQFKARMRNFDQAIMAAAVHAVDIDEVLGEGLLPVHVLHERTFGPPHTLENSRLEQVQGLIRDRLTISEMVVGAGMNNTWGQGNSPYAKELTQREADDLNAAAADTIERLHLLRRYGVSSFQVDAETMGLPWDIAVMPPLSFNSNGEPEYAEGAVADFIFLYPDEHTDIDLRFDEDSDTGATMVNPGDAQAVMRFRLHDNGQISHGLGYHNTPSDLTQATFEENDAGSAFMRLRGLLIATAFDAVVPDVLVRGPIIQTSVAERLARRPLRPDQSARSITDLLLRRRRVLQDAGIRPGHSTPKGDEWQGPTRAVDGYRRRLPAGTHRRPEAEEQARRFYAGIGVAFDGLADGENFVNGYNRPVDTEVPYRHARFRRDSETRKFMRSIAPVPTPTPQRHRSQADQLRERLRGVDPAVVTRIMQGAIDPDTLARIMKMARGNQQKGPQ